MKLTQRTVDAIGEVDRPRIFFDSALRGFGFRVSPGTTKSPAGARTYIFEYRPAGGGRSVAKRRIKLGDHANLKCSDAREMAKQARADVQNGRDPALERTRKRQEATLTEAYALYKAQFLGKLKPRTQRSYDDLWRLYLLPQLGRKRLSDLSQADLRGLYRKVGEVAGRKTTANRIVAVFKAFWGTLPVCLDAPGFSLENPAKGLKLAKENGRERFLSPMEIGRLFDALARAETEGIPWVERKNWKKGTVGADLRKSLISPNTADALRLLIFTGCRRNEVVRLTWGEVDLERGVLWLADSKTGRKAVVLSTASIKLLESVRARVPYDPNADDAVFPDQLPEVGKDGKRPKALPRSDLNRPWLLVLRGAGLSNVRLHDLRHSFASIAVQDGLSLPQIGKMLGHSSPQTTARYAHLDFSAQRRAVDMVADRIQEALPSAPASAANEATGALVP